MYISDKWYRLIALISVILASISTIGVVITVYLIIEQLNQARIALEEAKITRAWATLTVSSPYNTGKNEAFGVLAVKGQDLKKINVSCENMMYERPGGQALCEEGEVLTYLDGLNLSVQKIGRVVDLYGANFSGGSLVESNFSGGDLLRALFAGARMDGAKFIEANLTLVLFEGAYALKINLERASLVDAELSNATFPCATLKEATLLRASLISIDLSNTSSCHSNLSDADLTAADLTNANLTGANLSNADFTDAILSETNFSCAWAWEDLLPSAEDLITDSNIYQFNKETHQRDTRPAPCEE